MKVVKHPRIEGIKYEVPDDVADRWVKSGWLLTDEAPAESDAEAPAQITVGSDETPPDQAASNTRTKKEA